MPFADANSQLEPLLFQMKQYKNLTKSTIEILPSSGQSEYGPNKKCIFTLPYASMISLEDLALHFVFEPDSVPTTSTDKYPAQRILPPRDVASLISEVDIKINGATIQHLTQYNDIVNLLNLFEDAKTAKKVLQNANPAKTKVPGENGVFIDMDATFNHTKAAHNNKATRYVINSWYGLLGHRGDEVSSNFIDTNMLGEVTIAFTFASANACAAVNANGIALKAGFGATSSLDASGLETQITNAIAAGTPTYKLSDLKMSMVRYNLPMAYSEALASNLSSGAKYQIAFNHYEMRSQNVSDANRGTIRWNENSRDIKGLLAFFTKTTRGDSVKPSDYSSKVNTSEYFTYANPIHESSQFQIGSVKMPQNALKSSDAFLEVVRAVPGARGNNVEFYNQVETLEGWLETYFMAYLSLEMTEGMTEVANGGKKLLSGLSSEQLPISCSYHFENDNTFKGSMSIDNNVNVMTLSTRVLVIENGQSCYVDI